MRIRIYGEPYNHHILKLHIEQNKSDLQNDENDIQQDANDEKGNEGIINGFITLAEGFP